MDALIELRIWDAMCSIR